MWATLIVAGFFALLILIVLLRADKTMANGALAVIALLAIGIASTASVRGFGTPVRVAADPAVDVRGNQHVALAPALACLDGLAGESVEAACEKAVFASPDTAAAAVSYAADQVSRVVASSNARALTPEQQLVKRSVERDRYGLVAQVITIRDRCVVTDCPLFRVLSETSQIKSNMNERLYDTLVARYSTSWAGAGAAAPAPVAGLLPGPPSASAPTGKPNTVDFATSAAIPPVNIMTADPPAQAVAAPAPAAKPAASAPAAKAASPSPAAPSTKSANAQAQAKRTPAPAATTSPGQPHQPSASVGKPRVVAPVPYVPSQATDD